MDDFKPFGRALSVLAYTFIYSLLVCSKPLAYVLLDAGSDVAFLGSLVELLACDVLVQLDVAAGYALCILVGNLWHSLARLVHEVVLDEPLTNELLRELALRLTLLKLLLVTVGIEVAARVRSVWISSMR